MLALHFLDVVFAHPVLLGIEMALVSAPAIGVIAGDTKRLQQRFELEENLVFAPSKHVCQYLSRVRVMIESCVRRERRRILGELCSHRFRFKEGYA